MAQKKLLNRLQQYFEADPAAQRKELDAIRKVTKKLKKKADSLNVKLDATAAGNERDELAAKIAVIEAQRNRALKLIEERRGRSEKTKA
jgi:hypothetical protein